MLQVGPENYAPSQLIGQLFTDFLKNLGQTAIAAGGVGSGCNRLESVRDIEDRRDFYRSNAFNVPVCHSVMTSPVKLV